MSATIELSYRRWYGGEPIPDWFREQEKHFGVNHVVLIDSHSTCGPMGRQTFEAVAMVIDIESPNPGICFRQPITAGLATKILLYIQERPWEDV